MQSSVVAGATDFARSMLEPFRAKEMIGISFTNKCPLRCVYCPQGTHEEGFHADTGDALLDEIVHWISRHRVPKVSLGYYGETTMIKDWHIKARRILDLGVSAHINSAFQRVLNDDELAVLARFHSVYMSIDTADIEVHKSIRKAVDPRTIVYNLHRLRAYAHREGIPQPEVTWTGVMTDQAAMRLREFVSFALSNGIRNISFNALVDYRLDNDVRDIFELEGNEWAAVAAELIGASQMAQKAGINFRIDGADRINRKLQGLKEEEQPKVYMHMIQGTAPVIKPSIEPGQTRQCVYPWNSLYLDPKGDAYACCARGESMGVVKGTTTIDDVMSNDAYKALRLALLTGNNLDSNCRNCALNMPIVPVEQMQAAVASVVAQESGVTARPMEPVS